MNAERVRILIVEDEAAHAEAIRRAFQNAELEAEVEVAGSLRDYRAAIAAKLPDLALVDLNLPDGRALEILSAPPESGDFPILIMTSYGNEQIVVEALKAGAFDYVVKSASAFAAMPRVVTRALREWGLLRQRQQAERELRQSEARFRAVARLSSDFAYSCLRTEAGECVVDWITDAFYALTGSSEEDLRARGNWLLALHPEDRPRFLELLESLRPGQTASGEFRMLARDGSVRWLANRIECEAESGTPGGLRFHGAVRDVTDRRRAESATQSSTVESEPRLEPERAQGQASGGDADGFAGASVRDLKAPLRDIEECARLLAERRGAGLSAEDAACLNRIQQAAVRMERLIDSLLG
ncbi:MAG: response regulator [Candidatus Competibacter sp.]|nr:response regulator [Candidatus Competibacter sp.]